MTSSRSGAMRDGLIKRRDIFERWRFTLLGRVAQMFVEPAVSGSPCSLIRPPHPCAEPLANKRMRVERVGCGGIRWYYQPPLAQTRNSTPPFAVIKFGDM